MTDFPIDGKGFFIWRITAPYEQYLELLIAGNYRHAIVKIADGTSRYNISSDGTDRAKGLVELLRGNNIRVWGYQYIYLDYPTGEAEVAVSRCAYLQVDGYVMNGEVECKGKFEQAADFCSSLRRRAPTLPIALCSYRYPSLHATFPWEQFLSISDIHMPQVYWLLSTNPAVQLEKSYNELMKLKNLPFIPVGCAFTHGTWKPTPEQEIQFMDKAKSMGMPAVNFWELNHTKQNLPVILSTISAYDYPYTEQEPPDNGGDGDTEMPDKVDELIAAMNRIQIGVGSENVVFQVHTDLESVLFGETVPDNGGNGGDPIPSNVKQVRNAPGEKANGHWQVGWNGVHKPMLAIKDNANGDPEKQWKDGQIFQVYTPDADVDGSTKFYKVYGVVYTGNEFGNNACYVKEPDIEFV